MISLDGRSLVQLQRAPSPFQLLPWLPVALVVALLKKQPEPEKGLQKTEIKMIRRRPLKNAFFLNPPGDPSARVRQTRAHKQAYSQP